jgi:hypothetical protein
VSYCTVEIDAQDYFPSVRFKRVQKAVEYHSNSLPDDVQDTIYHCLRMIHFGMKSTLFTFQGHYYKYNGEADDNNRGLTIGGYKSAWLADLVGAIILDNTQELFTETLFDGFYCDDGFAVFQGTCSYAYLSD